MKLTMGTLQLVLLQLCVSLYMVDCNSLQERSPPRPLLLEDPSGSYTLLNSSDTHSDAYDERSLIHEYQRMLMTGMYILSGSDHSLAKFLLTLTSQHQLVCPDEKNCTLQTNRGRYDFTVENNRVQVQWSMKNNRGWFESVMVNFAFERVTACGLFCTDREWFSPEDNQLVIYTLHFRLIPGVCFTRYQHLSFCDKPRILFPNDSKCVRFFRGENCSGGAVVDIYPDGWNMMENAILGSKSFAFC